MKDTGTVLITGATSGIGFSLAQSMAQAGYCVYGSARSKTRDVPQGVHRVEFELSDESAIKRAVQKIHDERGGIDLLVNNAGATLTGAIEETSIEQMQWLFDVNVFGAIRATQAVLPKMRERGRGTIIFISSVVGFLPAPLMATYGATKHALESYSESLDHEVRNFGIRSVLVEPGFTRTAIDASASSASRPLSAYDDMRAKALQKTKDSVDAGDDPQRIADVVMKIAKMDHPGVRYTAGKNAGMLSVLRKIMPDAMFGKQLRKEFGID